MAIGDVYRFELIGRLHGQNTANVLFLRVEAQAGLGAEQTNIGIGWFDFLSPSWAAATSQDFAMVGFSLQKITPPQLEKLSLFRPEVPGTILSPSLPSSLAALLNTRGGQFGRSRMGRVFVPAIPTSRFLGNNLTQAQITVLAGPAGALLTTIEVGVAPDTSQMKYVIFSRKLNETVGPIQVNVRAQIATCRHRLPGKGSIHFPV